MPSVAFIVASLLCLASGATGLIYETLWIRVLSLGVGSTSNSMSIVLSIFFLGLSVGSVLAGKKIEKVQNPLLIYGLIEGVLGIYSAFVIFPLMGFHHLVAFFAVSSFSIVGSLLKFVFVFLLLGLPSMCMGATLPLLVKFFLRGGAVGGTVSRLYAINTFGAVVGAFLTGFVLIPHWGVLLANTGAAILSLVISLVAIVYSKRLKSDSLSGIVSSVVKAKESALVLTSQQKLILLSCGLSGFVSIVCEVVWTKYLGIYFGTNIYGLGLVLSIYLVGIALGSALLGLFVEKVRSQFNLYVSLFVASAVFITTASQFLSHAPEWANIIAGYSKSLLGVHLSLIWIKSFLGAVILILPTLCFGALFPLGITLISSKTPGDNVPRLVGVAYAVNTAGAILGSYLAGIVFIPHLGSGVTIIIAASLSLVGAAGLLALNWTASAFRIPASVGLAGALVFTILLGHMDFSPIIRSAYHTESTHARELEKGEEFQLVVEGETGVISLSHDPRDGENYRNYYRLKTNGLNESVYNMENLNQLPKYEALIGLLPYVFSRNPHRAFIVGYGGGFTVDFLTSTDLKEVNVVELEKGILKAADYVYQHKNPILERPNLRLQIEDARYVLTSKQLGKLDIIVSQPSHSWVSGAANLFTKEFFEIVKGNLAERGVFSQWLNLYNMDVSVLKSILKTFYEVFPYGAVFTERGDDELVLIGSLKPLDFNLQKLDRIADNEIFRQKLGSVFRASTYDLLSLYSLSRQDVLDLTKDTNINTDSNAYAEVNQSAIFYEGLKGRQTPQNYLSAVFRGDYSPILRLSDTKNLSFYDELMNSMNETGQKDKLFVVLKRYEEESQGRGDFARLGYFCLKSERYPSALKYLEKSFKKKQNVDTLNLILSSLTEMDRFGEVIEWSEKYPNVRNKVTECYLTSAFVEKKKLKEADALASKMVKNIAGYTTDCGDYFNRVAGSYYLAKNDYATAIPFFEAYYEHFSTEPSTVKKMVQAYRGRKDEGNAIAFGKYLSELQAREAKRLEQMADFFIGAGLKEDAKALSLKAYKLSQDTNAGAIAE